MSALAMHDGLHVPPWQGWTLLAVYALAFVLPAVYVARHARRHGDPWLPWFLLTLLASVLGVWQYFIDRRIRERKAHEEEGAQD